MVFTYQDDKKYRHDWPGACVLYSNYAARYSKAIVIK